MAILSRQKNSKNVSTTGQIGSFIHPLILRGGAVQKPLIGFKLGGKGCRNPHRVQTGGGCINPHRVQAWEGAETPHRVGFKLGGQKRPIGFKLGGKGVQKPK